MQGQNPITSEEYADFIIEYQGDPSLLEMYGDTPITIINSTAALVNIPQGAIKDTSVYSYARVPSLGTTVSAESLEASGILKIRKIPNFNLQGNGVLLAIIDTGVDFTNPIFQYEDKTTRIAAIWDQTIEGGEEQETVRYGTVYSRERINNALQSENPFDIVPSRDNNGHGTMVAGIAGGRPVPEQGFYGVAPGAEFIVVKLKQAKEVLRKYYFIPENTVCYQETDFLFALEFVLAMADSLQKPLVICVTVNASQGAHDGRSLTGRYLSSVASRSDICVVIAAGNEGIANRHFYGRIDPITGYQTVELNVGEHEKGFTMELWGQSPSIFYLDILTPSGEYVPKITAARNERRTISFIFDKTIIEMDFNLVETESGDQLILFRFTDPSPGIWRFNVYEKGDLKVGFHIWLPMEGFISEQTFFVHPDPGTTILGMGNAQIPVTVTAYQVMDDSLFMNSSRGYTRMGLVKPNIAAPGVNVIGPTLTKEFAGFSGTSIAAAHTAGVAAMLLEWGVVKGNLLGMSTIDINKLFMRGARRSAGIEYPNPDWGFGILDIFNVYDSLRTGNL